MQKIICGMKAGKIRQKKERKKFHCCRTEFNNVSPDLYFLTYFLSLFGPPPPQRHAHTHTYTMTEKESEILFLLFFLHFIGEPYTTECRLL